MLCLPGKLLPPFSITPLSVSVHLHRPIGLSLLVLQPVLNVASHSAIPAGYELGDYDFTSYYDRDESHIHLSNGNGTNGLSTKVDKPPLIMRQEALITVPHRTGLTQSFKVLLTDPVQQGTLNRSTRIVISTEPHIINAQADWVDGDGAVSESSHGRTTRSMADFDPDAFLSASLDLHTDHGDDNGLAGMEDSSLDAGELSQSISETSGSITPRPNGVGFTRPPSPPVDVKDVFAADQEVEYLGTSFTPVVSQGPSSSRSSDEEICWLSVAGLGRAGIFEGDWVSRYENMICKLYAKHPTLGTFENERSEDVYRHSQLFGKAGQGLGLGAARCGRFGAVSRVPTRAARCSYETQTAQSRYSHTKSVPIAVWFLYT